MTTSFANKILAVGGVFLLLAVGRIQAQQRFGGFGGFGGFNRNQQNSSSSSSAAYNYNGTVGGASFAIDPDTHSIVVIADEETGRQIKEVLNNLDRPKPQVLIKVVFLEVQHNDSLDLGVEGGWSRGFGNSLTGNVANTFGLSGLNSATTNLNVFGAPVAGALTSQNNSGFYQIIGTDFQATLRAVASAGKAQLLSRPSILARDGQPATITIGQSVPLVTSVSYSGLANTPINNVTYTDVGIILKVTPFISANGTVEMILEPEISSVDPTQSTQISSGVTSPYLNVRSADTVVVTPDGQTVVIGGLMEDNGSSSESKVPILGDIPLLGNLFKHKTKSGGKTELLIFLTPHIISAPGELADMSDSEKSHTFTPKSYSEPALDRFLEKVPVKKGAPGQ